MASSASGWPRRLVVLCCTLSLVPSFLAVRGVPEPQDELSHSPPGGRGPGRHLTTYLKAAVGRLVEADLSAIVWKALGYQNLLGQGSASKLSFTCQGLPAWLVLLQEAGTHWALQGVPAPLDLGRTLFSCQCPTCQPTPVSLTVTLTVTLPRLLTSASVADPAAGDDPESSAPGEANNAVTTYGDAASEWPRVEEEEGLGQVGPAEASRGPSSTHGHKSSVTKTPTTQPCQGGNHVASLVLSADPAALTASQRIKVMRKAGEFLSLPAAALTWLTTHDQRLQMLERGFRLAAGGALDPHPAAAAGGDSAQDESEGAGLVTSELVWPLACAATRHLPEFLRVLQHNVGVGRVGREVGVAVLGWYVAVDQRAQPLSHGKRRRRRAAQRTPSPTPTLYPQSATPSPSRSSAAWRQPQVEMTGLARSPPALPAHLATLTLDDAAVVVTQTPAMPDSSRSPELSSEFTRQPSDVEPVARSDGLDLQPSVQLLSSVDESWYFSQTPEVTLPVSLWLGGQTSLASLELSTLSSEPASSASLPTPVLATGSVVEEAAPEVLPAVVDVDSVERRTDHVTTALADLPSSQIILPTEPLPLLPPRDVSSSHQASRDLLTAEIQPTGVVFHLQTPAISSEILYPAVSSEILYPAVSGEILYPVFSSEILYPAVSSEILYPAVSSEILVLAVSSEILDTPVSSEILARNLSSEILDSSVSSEILDGSVSSENMATSIFTEILATAVPIEILNTITTSFYFHIMDTSLLSEILDVSSEILLKTFPSKILATPFSIELSTTTVPGETLHTAVSTASEILTTSVFDEIVPTAVSSKIPTVAISSEIEITPVFEPAMRTDYSAAITKGPESVTYFADVSPSIVFPASVTDGLLWTTQKDTAAPGTSAFLWTRDAVVLPWTSAGPLAATEVSAILSVSPGIETVWVQASQTEVHVSSSDVSSYLTSVWTKAEQDLFITPSVLASQAVSWLPGGCLQVAATGAGSPELSCVDVLAATTEEFEMDSSSVETLPAARTQGTFAVGLSAVMPSVVHSFSLAWPSPEDAELTPVTSAFSTGLLGLAGESSALPEAFTGHVILPSLSTTVVAWPVATSAQPLPAVSRAVDAEQGTASDVTMTTTGEGVTVAAGIVSPTADNYDLTPTLSTAVEPSTEASRESLLSQAETLAPATSLIETSLSTTAVLLETAGPSSATVLPATAESPAVSPPSMAVTAAEATETPTSSPAESDTATLAAPTTAEPFLTSAGTSASAETLSAAPTTVPAAITPATTATSASTPSATSTEAPPSEPPLPSVATSPTTASTRSSASRPWWVTTPDETDVEITSVAGSVDVPNNPPFLVHSLSYLTAHLGRCFRHPIPPDMFHDVEDGNTPHLTLTLTLPFDQPLPPNFWVQLDTGGQALQGLPLVADLDTGYHSVVLVATDSKGMGVRNPINLYVNSSAFTLFTHRFIMKFSVDFGQFMRRRDNIMSLLERLSSFAGDVTTDHVTVVDVSIGSFVMSWTNSSLSGASCPNDTIHELLYRMVRRDGAVRSAFSRHMGKKLKLESLTYQPDGACLSRPPLPPPSSTSTPTSSTPPGGKGEGGSSAHLLTDVILPVLIALLILLLLTVLLLFLYRCRQQRQNSSLETLDKDLYTVDRTPVILPHEMPGVQAYSVRPRTPTLLPYDHRDPALMAGGGGGGGGSFPRATHQGRPRSYQPYRQPGGASLSRDRPNSYTFEGEVNPHRLDARPVTVIFNNFDSAPRRSRPPSYWNDHNEETPPNICVPPPYPKDLSNTTLV